MVLNRTWSSLSSRPMRASSSWSRRTLAQRWVRRKVLRSSTRLMVITTTTASALAAGSTLARSPTRPPRRVVHALARSPERSMILGGLLARPLYAVCLGVGDDRISHRRRRQHRAADTRRPPGQGHRQSGGRRRPGMSSPIRASRCRGGCGCIGAPADGAAEPDDGSPFARCGAGDSHGADPWSQRSIPRRRLGKIPSGIPPPHLPSSRCSLARPVAGAAAVAVIVLVQGTGVAEAAPNPGGSLSDPDRDFLAQGVGNVASGCFAACRSAARSARPP